MSSEIVREIENFKNFTRRKIWAAEQWQKYFYGPKFLRENILGRNFIFEKSHER